MFFFTLHNCNRQNYLFSFWQLFYILPILQLNVNCPLRMDDFFRCNHCQSTMQAHLPICPYCCKEHHNCHTTIELLSFCAHLDQLIQLERHQEALRIIRHSAFHDQPMVQFRKTILLLRNSISSSLPIEKQHIVTLFGSCIQVTVHAPSYWDRFVPYLVSLLPSPALHLYPEECSDILMLSNIPRLDLYAVLRKKLIDQLLLGSN